MKTLTIALAALLLSMSPLHAQPLMNMPINVPIICEDVDTAMKVFNEVIVIEQWASEKEFEAWKSQFHPKCAFVSPYIFTTKLVEILAKEGNFYMAETKEGFYTVFHCKVDDREA